jgi:hypothetical protein
MWALSLRQLLDSKPPLLLREQPQTHKSIKQF